MINKAKKLIKDFGLSEIRAGMKITAKQLANDKITVQFPEERTPISPRFRGLHALRRYPMERSDVLHVNYAKLFVLPMPLRSNQR